MLGRRGHQRSIHEGEDGEGEDVEGRDGGGGQEGVDVDEHDLIFGVWVEEGLLGEVVVAKNEEFGAKHEEIEPKIRNMKR